MDLLKFVWVIWEFYLILLVIQVPNNYLHHFNYNNIN